MQSEFKQPTYQDANAQHQDERGYNQVYISIWKQNKQKRKLPLRKEMKR